jgi:hypothetical protein
MRKVKIGVVSALVLAGIATPLVIQHEEQVKLRRENDLLRQRVEHLAPLEAENARLAKIVAESPRQERARDDSSNEALRLRGEVARLREDLRELTAVRTAAPSPSPVVDASLDAAAQSLVARAGQLRDRLEQAPQTKIPELQFLTERDWLNAVGSVKQLESEEDFRRALSSLRSRAKGVFGGMMQKALRQYVEANGGTLPTELGQLQAYLDSPVDPELLDRYSLIATANDARQAKALIAEKAPPVDDEYDSQFEFSLNSSISRSVNKTANALEAAAVAYAQANKGQLPIEASQVAPYLQQPLDPTVVQEFLSKRLPRVTPLEPPKVSK